MDTPRLVSRESHTQSGRGRASTLARRCSHLCLFLTAVAFLGLALTSAVSAFNYVPTPTAPTGASRTSPRRASTPAASAPRRSRRDRPARTARSINGFGGIKVLVHDSAGPALQRRADARIGLTFDGADRFTTTQSIALGGVTISRSVYINTQSAELGALARHLHQHHERAAHDQGRLRRPVGLSARPAPTRARSSTRPPATRWSPPPTRGSRWPRRSRARRSSAARRPR